MEKDPKDKKEVKNEDKNKDEDLDKDIEDIIAQLEKMVDDDNMEDFGVSFDKFKKIQEERYEKGKYYSNKLKMFKIKMFLKFVLQFLFSFILLIAITGYIKWVSYTNVWQVLLLFGTFICIDKISLFLLRKIIPTIYVLFFGITEYIMGAISLLISVMVIPNIHITSTWKVIIVFLLYEIIKSIINYLLFEKNNRIKIVTKKGDKDE